MSKRKISILIILIIIINILQPICLATAETKLEEKLIEAWDGTTEQPTETIKKDNKTYYQINNAKQLAYIEETGGVWLNRNYILTNDIVLNDVEIEYTDSGALQTEPELLKEWKPIAGKRDEVFEGIFDGDNHTISGLYINDTIQKDPFDDCYTGVRIIWFSRRNSKKYKCNKCIYNGIMECWWNCRIFKS